MSESILFFVPMYCCSPQIGRVIAQFEQLAGMNAPHAILCVDNRSPDDTLAAAERALAALSVQNKCLVRNDDNYGLGGSHKVAFDYARDHGFDHVVVLHGDDQGSIADLLPLLRKGAHTHVDALLGARFMSGSRLEGYSAFRTWANRGFNLIFSIVAGKTLSDLGSGLNLFRRAPFDHGFHRKYADDLTFNYYLIFGLADHGLRFRFFPISWREDDQVSNVKLFSHAKRMLALLWNRMTRPKAFHSAEYRMTSRESYPYTVMRTWEK
ncbi:MAG: glycosyltransferase family 2 protein [Novosphingobium sp.]